jgi:hypothetical protein
MSESIDQYVQREGNLVIIDRGIIGKKIQSSDGGEAEVVDVACDKKDQYITVRSGINTYRIHVRLFQNFKLID